MVQPENSSQSGQKIHKKVDEAGQRWRYLETMAQTDQNMRKMNTLSSQLFFHYSNLSSCAKRRKQDPKVDEMGRRWCQIETTAETDQNITKMVPLSSQHF